MPQHPQHKKTFRAFAALTLIGLTPLVGSRSWAGGIARGIPQVFGQEIQSRKSKTWGTCSELLTRALMPAEKIDLSIPDGLLVIADHLLSVSSTYGEYIMLVQAGLRAQADQLLKREIKKWIPRGLIQRAEQLLIGQDGRLRGLKIVGYENFFHFLAEPQNIAHFKALRMDSLEVELPDYRGSDLIARIQSAASQLEQLAQAGALKNLSIKHFLPEDYDYEGDDAFQDPGNDLGVLVTHFVLDQPSIQTQLRHLGLINLNIPSLELLLAKMRSLTSLDLSGSQLPLGIEKTIAAHRELNQLSLHNVTIGKFEASKNSQKLNLKILASLVNLSELNVGGYYKYMSADLSSLTALTRLISLNIETVDRSISKKSLAVLCKHLRNLKILQIGQVEGETNPYLSLATLPHLKELRTTHAILLGYKELEALQKKNVQFSEEFYDFSGRAIENK